MTIIFSTRNIVQVFFIPEDDFILMISVGQPVIFCPAPAKYSRLLTCSIFSTTNSIQGFKNDKFGMLAPALFQKSQAPECSGYAKLLMIVIFSTGNSSVCVDENLIRRIYCSIFFNMTVFLIGKEFHTYDRDLHRRRGQ